MRRRTSAGIMSDGKAVLVLRVLEHQKEQGQFANREYGTIEGRIYDIARKEPFNGREGVIYLGELRTLADKELVDRRGQRGGYLYKINDAGLALLREIEEMEAAEVKRQQYQHFLNGQYLNDLDLRGAAHHAQLIGDRETERKIDIELEKRGQS